MKQSSGSCFCDVTIPFRTVSLKWISNFKKIFSLFRFVTWRTGRGSHWTKVIIITLSTIYGGHTLMNTSIIELSKMHGYDTDPIWHRIFLKGCLKDTFILCRHHLSWRYHMHTFTYCTSLSYIKSSAELWLKGLKRNPKPLPKFVALPWPLSYSKWQRSMVCKFHQTENTSFWVQNLSNEWPETTRAQL